MKLNLGAGDCPLDGYINIDHKTGGEVYPLSHGNESVNEIRASHILEHFSHREVEKVLSHWIDKLKPGGVLKISVPDFAKLVDHYKAGDQIKYVGVIMGGQTDEDDYHKCIFDQSSLTKLMENAGLENISAWSDDAKDCSNLPISLNLQGAKPEKAEVCKLSVKIGAIMSMPRLAFTDNMTCAIRELPAGIDIQVGKGVFWGQVMTRLIDYHLNKGADWLLAIDYDTYFTNAHFMKLGQILAENPHIDAIAPLQMMRENNTPLFNMPGMSAGGAVRIDRDNPTIQVGSAHFGLTIFRLEKFKNLKKPWFYGKPAPDGGWGDGRVDDDIAFWQNWTACGNTVYLATNVMVGHMQLMCTWPGKPENGYSPVHMNINDMTANGIPEWTR
jgi:hypothetical protein